MRLIPIILSGGVGSRLWPVSRDLHPKPFIKLQDGLSLLQHAFIRSMNLPGVVDLITVTNHELLFKTREEFLQVNTQQKFLSCILEPCGRNTAAAITAAALHIQKQYTEKTIMLVLSADHLILDQEAFEQAVNSAVMLAKTGKLVTFGMQPTTPETAYGYIEADGYNVLNFIEKPSLEKAQEYLQSKRYLWNAGIFCFTTESILQEIQQHCAEILSATQTCFNLSRARPSHDVYQLELDKQSFQQVPDQSIDYAVMEHSANIAVVPCNIGWSDLGSWNALSNLVPQDSNHNRIQGEIYTHAAHNNYIYSENRVVGAVGVNNLLIIDTPDALLIANQDHAQDVKHIYNQLKTNNNSVHKIHRTVVRPWGTYTILEEGPGFKIKRIEVKPGASLSLQMHLHRSEHWVVVQGTATVINADQLLSIKVNESTYIPAGNKHRLTNNTTDLVIIIEVQSGSYLGEDDIIRFDDIYGRAEAEIDAIPA
jgi:mannose-1-phosphate guanylyltransferase / mannose-6-phosphate isomerase